MKVTYYSSLYEKDVTVRVSGDIDFVERYGINGIAFCSMGHKQFVELSRVIRIEKA